MRYCEMCDKWVPSSQTTCKACGMPTRHADTASPRVRSVWNAISRAEQEVFGDHLTFHTMAPLIIKALEEED